MTEGSNKEEEARREQGSHYCATRFHGSYRYLPTYLYLASIVQIFTISQHIVRHLEFGLSFSVIFDMIMNGRGFNSHGKCISFICLILQFLLYLQNMVNRHIVAPDRAQSIPLLRSQNLIDRGTELLSNFLNLIALPASLGIVNQ